MRQYLLRTASGRRYVLVEVAGRSLDEEFRRWRSRYPEERLLSVEEMVYLPEGKIPWKRIPREDLLLLWQGNPPADGALPLQGEV